MPTHGHSSAWEIETKNCTHLKCERGKINFFFCIQLSRTIKKNVFANCWNVFHIFFYYYCIYLYSKSCSSQVQIHFSSLVYYFTVQFLTVQPFNGKIFFLLYKSVCSTISERWWLEGKSYKIKFAHIYVQNVHTKRSRMMEIKKMMKNDQMHLCRFDVC